MFGYGAAAAHHARPEPIYFFANSPICSGVTSCMAVLVSPSMRGKPAFGLAHSGRSGALSAYSPMTFSMFPSVMPHLAPTSAAPFSLYFVSISFGLTPINCRLAPVAPSGPSYNRNLFVQCILCQPGTQQNPCERFNRKLLLREQFECCLPGLGVTQFLFRFSRFPRSRGLEHTNSCQVINAFKTWKSYLIYGTCAIGGNKSVQWIRAFSFRSPPT